MTITREFIRSIRKSEAPFIRQAIELAEHFADVRKRVADEGGDWSVLKALLKAEILDEEGGDHVKKLLDRVSDSAGYADLLGFGINKKSFSSRGSSTLGSASAFQAERGGFDSRGPLQPAPATSRATGTGSGEGAAERVALPAAPSSHSEIAPTVADTRDRGASTLAGTGGSSGGSGVEVLTDGGIPQFLQRA